MKQYLIGAITMLCACSVAFNIYQAGQLKSCVVAPTIEKIEVK